MIADIFASLWTIICCKLCNFLVKISRGFGGRAPKAKRFYARLWRAPLIFLIFDVKLVFHSVFEIEGGFFALDAVQ
jgi:hypothetical protein